MIATVNAFGLVYLFCMHILNLKLILISGGAQQLSSISDVSSPLNPRLLYQTCFIALIVEFFQIKLFILNIISLRYFLRNICLFCSPKTVILYSLWFHFVHTSILLQWKPTHFTVVVSWNLCSSLEIIYLWLSISILAPLSLSHKTNMEFTIHTI